MPCEDAYGHEQIVMFRSLKA